jgi:hypothetical protein
MPKIFKSSCIIDTPRLISSSEELEDQSYKLDLFIRSLADLYKRGSRIFLVKEPFTSNIKIDMQVFRLGFTISSIIVESEDPKNIEDFCKKFSGYISTEDLWLRTRSLDLCVKTNDSFISELLLEEIGSYEYEYCNKYSLITRSLEKDLIRTDITNDINEMFIFVSKERFSEKEAVEISLIRNYSSLHIFSHMIDGLKTRCVLIDNIVSSNDQEIIAYSSINRRPVIYYEDPKIIISLCTPVSHKDPLYKLSLLYLLFKE